ncbi:hypothetical protein LPJ66_003434 [Kickxella alabastrina]|uniref:Uncharacterized protein n=1 Tax=Kickxella alabastrina TaxID=61397 RepID=A0ACC1IN56_9FUNG|nr:hypothetical protein LPJ66_003434 [Kickxella alabastrina]
MFNSLFGSGGTTYSGPIMAGKQRCPQCGTSKLRARRDGRVMCRNGHQQEGMFEEVTEAMIDGITRRRFKTTKRIGRKEMQKSRRLYGNNARFLILESMQFILKKQVTALVEDLGAPEALLGVVRHLWLLYVSKMKNIYVSRDASEEFWQKDEEEGEKTRVNKAEQHSGSVADALYSQQYSQAKGQSQTQTAESGADHDMEYVEDSLDALLKRVDDITREEQEVIEWERRRTKIADHGSPRSQSPGSDASDAEEATGAAEASEQAALSATENERKRINWALVAHIEEFIHMEYLPALLWLSFAWLKLPLTHTDMYWLMADEHVPYVSGHQWLPESMTSRMGKNIINIFIVPFAVTPVRMRALTRAFQTFFDKHCEISFTPIDNSVLLRYLVRRLGIGMDVHAMVLRLLEHLEVQPDGSGAYRRQFEVILMSAIVVVLKLHYGLDEIERVHDPENGEELGGGLPPLGDFLRKWRSDWERELSVSFTPDLTALGERWEREFAAYCRRRLVRRGIPTRRVAYREVATRYRRIVEELAEQIGGDPEAARRLLPPEYVAKKSGGGTKAAAVDGIGHIRMPVLEPAGGVDEAYESIVEPFDNYPEIRLRRGEMYAAIQRKDKFGNLPGYTVPVMGLVTARCALVAGCQQSTLLFYISHLESRLRARARMHMKA